MNRAIDSAPDWFSAALAAPCKSHCLNVEGADLHYLEWGRRGAHPLILIHGGAAHARWWQFLAPFWARHYHVIAPDLSGHGDSGHRTTYPRAIWAQEMAALASEVFGGQKPVLVGHSMGGLVAVVSAALFPDAFAAIAVIDSPIRRPDPESQARMTPPSLPQAKVYPDLATAMSRFRLIPEQPCAHPFILEHLARSSLKEVPGGWSWKFDPLVFAKSSIVPMHEYLAQVRLPIALFRGSDSTIVPPEMFAYMKEQAGQRAIQVEIPQAHHHLILDQPLAFVSAISCLLSALRHGP